MIAAQIFIAKGSNSMLQASNITARFVKMHRTQVPRVPNDHLLFETSCCYSHVFPLHRPCALGEKRFSRNFG